MGLLQSPALRRTLKRVLPRPVVLRLRALLGARGGAPLAGPLDRAALARLYIAGSGIEVGALHNPLPVGPTARVTYVDRIPASEMQKFEDHRDLAIGRIDVIDDGENLRGFADASQDFVIANHVLEHCPNLLLTFENMYRVVRPDGILFFSLPDKRYMFDRDRPVTPLEHLIRDYREGPKWNERQHFEEWCRFVNKRDDEAVVQREVEHLLSMDYRPHYHVWTQADFLAVLLYARERWPFDIEAFVKSGEEMVMVLRKAGARRPG